MYRKNTKKLCYCGTLYAKGLLWFSIHVVSAHCRIYIPAVDYNDRGANQWWECSLCCMIIDVAVYIAYKTYCMNMFKFLKYPNFYQTFFIHERSVQYFVDSPNIEVSFVVSLGDLCGSGLSRTNVYHWQLTAYTTFSVYKPCNTTPLEFWLLDVGSDFQKWVL